MSLYMYRMMLSPFVADSLLYVVYDTDTDVAVEELPVMTIHNGDGSLLCYRTEKAYKVASNISTHFFEQQHLNTVLPLTTGRVRYITSKAEAERVAHELYEEKIRGVVNCIVEFKDLLRRLVGSYAEYSKECVKRVN